MAPACGALSSGVRAQNVPALSISDWIPAVTTTGLFGFAVWLARTAIQTRLKAAVEAEFNSKLEVLRGDLRSSEERLRASLREKEAELAALRGGALSAMASRQIAVDRRRLEAVDQLWSSYSELLKCRSVAAMMAVVKFEEAARVTERDEKARQTFEMMGAGFDPKKLDLSGASKARPFVAPMVWAVFAAIQAITMHSIIRWTVLKTGIGNANLINDGPIAKLIVEVLPHQKDYLEKHGPGAYYYVLESLDSMLLAEIRKTLGGEDADVESVERAAKILALSNNASARDAKPLAP